MVLTPSHVAKSDADEVPLAGQTISAWGYSFQWTALHITREQYRTLKSSFDRLAEDCLSQIELQQQAEGSPSSDPYTILKETHKQNAILSQLWKDATTTSPWVDWDQIARGQKVFYRYGVAMTSGLAYQSLLGGTGRSGDIAETLAKTGGFSVKTARRRLLETTQFVIQVTQSLESIQPGGEGFAATLRVRFLHAKVRRRILQMTAKRPSYYNVEEYGVPINDMDCIATIHSFSSLLVWSALPQQGIFLRQQEIIDYLALWRLVAHYMGTPTSHLENLEIARATMETIQLYEFRPTETSKLLAQNIISALEGQPPVYPSRALIEANTRWLNGNALSDAFGIPRPSLYYWFLAAGQCFLVASTCYISRSIAPLDRWQIEAFRVKLWEVVMEAKYSGLGKLSVFNLQYVPGHDVEESHRTESKESRPQVFWTADRKALGILLVPAVFVLLLLGLVVRVGKTI